VTRAGLFVKLDDTGADGLVPIRTLGTEYYNYDETRHALVGSRSGAMHRLGDVVDVRLVEAQPIAGALRFELLSEGQVVPRGRNSHRFERSRERSEQHQEQRAGQRPGRSPREKKRKPEKKQSGNTKRGKSKLAKSKRSKSKRGDSWRR
jgi:ribonuclease R